MSSLVLELQRDALDKEVDVSNLLRKAMVVSKKLSITEIEEWIKNELSGYLNNESSIPKYREVDGLLRVHNPYRGWQPLHFSDPELGEIFSRREISQPVGELVAIVKNNSSKSLQVPFNQETKNYLMSMMKYPLEPTLIVDDIQIHGILDAVRNTVLNWALELEAKGIIGDGMSFSNEEKKVASQTTYQITNNIGSMENSQIQQDSNSSTQSQSIKINQEKISKFIGKLKVSVDALGLDKEDAEELKVEILTVEHQLTSPKPKDLIISESLKSIRSILEGIAGSVLATELLLQLSKLAN